MHLNAQNVELNCLRWYEASWHILSSVFCSVCFSFPEYAICILVLFLLMLVIALVVVVVVVVVLCQKKCNRQSSTQTCTRKCSQLIHSWMFFSSGNSGYILNIVKIIVCLYKNTRHLLLVRFWQCWLGCLNVQMCYLTSNYDLMQNWITCTDCLILTHDHCHYFSLAQETC